MTGNRYRAECKLCTKSGQVARNAKNKEEKREYNRTYREENHQAILQQKSEYRDENRETINEKQRRRRKEAPLMFRQIELKKSFKIDLAKFNQMLAEQGGVCAGCGTSEPKGAYNQWVVDHDHACCPKKRTCGKCVRGILCHHCNATLGWSQENIKRLLGLISYLQAKRTL